MTDQSALLTVLAVVAYGVWWWRTRYQPPTPPGDPLDPAGLREVDIVLAACQHLDHHPEHVPTAPIRARHADLDVRGMHLDGWGSTPHMLLCQVHNQDRHHLGAVHVRCSRPGCGTRGELDAGDPRVGMGDLRYRGWCNDGDRLVCPYCAGTRSRVWR